MWYEYTLYPLAIAALLFSLWAQLRVNSTFSRYSRVGTMCGKRSVEVARMMLDKAGLYHVRIERVAGNLTDHYDPRAEVLRLSDAVYDSSSAAAVGVAAHEAGHAIQHAVRYLPIVLRGALVKVTGFASRFTWIVILLGSLFMALDPVLGYYIVLFGIALFAVLMIFQLVTLPCEFDASRRAMSALRSSGYYTSSELSDSRRVLTAAALTYVASFTVTLVQLLRLIMRFTGNRRR